MDFTHEAATQAKNFQNTIVDRCWMYLVPSLFARSTLLELIEMGPANKILGFGGDHTVVEGCYAHSRMAWAAVTRVLTEKVAEGHLAERGALACARRLLRDNARELFRLGEGSQPPS